VHNTLVRIALILRTVRNLTVRQLFYLPFRRVQQMLPARLPPPPVVRSAAITPSVADTVRLVSVREGFVDRADAASKREFSFVGTTKCLAAIDWAEQYINPLWTFNLHYFDYARDLASAYRDTLDHRYLRAFEEVTFDWIDRCNPPSVGWQPYPTSLRIVNWVYSLILFGDSLPPEVRGRVAHSLAIQAAWLERRLEYHLDANHLQANFKALAMAGLYFEGETARRWRTRGLSGTWHALETQVHPDGAHYELSPMYHAIALGDFMEVMALAEAAGESVPGGCRERIRNMVRVHSFFSRPDGTLHLFNDAANGIAPAPSDLSRITARLRVSSENPTGVVALPEAGYWGMLDDEKGVRLIVDCGGPGPRNQPAHAHCDLLSFEFDLGGCPVVVDSGTSGYGGNPFREYVRSTRAHNTVQVDRKEQSEVWSTFRMGRRARVIRAHLEGSQLFRFSGAYESYDGSIIHERTFDLTRSRLRIEDRVLRAEGAMIRSFLHLHPAWRVDLEGERLIASADGHRINIRFGGAQSVRLAHGREADLEGWYCPSFGAVIASPVIVFECTEYDGAMVWFEIVYGGTDSIIE
jgi:uncharacterized heparinase superfamily protein